MVSFPGAKINLGLNIIEKRSDGFHEIESVFFPIPWYDGLELIENIGHFDHERKISLSVSGLEISGDINQNLITRAYDLVDADFDLPPVQAHLHKVIPMGAGLGGGSSDAACFLKMLNEKFTLGLTSVQLKAYASILGSDCAFFIENKPALATGKGEVLSPIELNLSGYYFICIWPGVHSNTAEAYQSITPTKPTKSCREIVGSGIENWKFELKNDFEPSVCARHSVISDLKSVLYQLGAMYASMSGSGSAVYGIFENKVPDIPEKFKQFPMVQSVL